MFGNVEADYYAFVENSRSYIVEAYTNLLNAKADLKSLQFRIEQIIKVMESYVSDSETEASSMNSFAKSQYANFIRFNISHIVGQGGVARWFDYPETFNAGDNPIKNYATLYGNQLLSRDINFYEEAIAINRTSQAEGVDAYMMVVSKWLPKFQSKIRELLPLGVEYKEKADYIKQQTIYLDTLKNEYERESEKFKGSVSSVMSFEDLLTEAKAAALKSQAGISTTEIGPVIDEGTKVGGDKKPNMGMLIVLGVGALLLSKRKKK